MVLSTLVQIGQFGRTSSGRGPSVTVSVLLPVDVLTRLDALIEEFDCPRSAAIRELVTEGLERLEAEWSRAQVKKLDDLPRKDEWEELTSDQPKQAVKKARRAK